MSAAGAHQCEDGGETNLVATCCCFQGLLNAHAGPSLHSY
jgi:hypothetical protein